MPKKNLIKKSSLAPTVLIAGGAGFLGSHIAEALLLKEAKVVALDNFKTGKQSYVNHLLTNPNFVLIDCDINTGIPADIQSVDYILHLAGLETYVYSDSDVNLDSLLTNALGTKNLLDFAKKSDAKFLLASSIDVYQGIISQIDLKDYFGSSNSEEKKYSQAEAKRFAEALVWEFFKRNNTDVRIVRLPEVFGPRMTFDACGDLGRMLEELTKNKNLSVTGEGVEKKHYLYIANAVTGVLKALFNEGTVGKIFPLVEQEGYSQLELVYLLRSLANRNVEIEFRPAAREHESEIKIPDTTNLKDLGWEARISLKEGIIKTLEWLGYEINTSSFKPAKLIEEKKKAKAPKEETLTSLVDTIAPDSVVAQPAPAKISEPQKPVEFVSEPVIQTHSVKFRIPISAPKLGIVPTIVFSVLFSGLVFFVGLPMGMVYWNTKTAVNELQKVPTYLAQFNSDQSKSSANTAYKKFYEAQVSLQNVKWLFALSGQSKLHSSLQDLFGSMSFFTKSTYNFSKAIVPFGSVWEILKPDTTATLSAEDFNKSQAELVIAKNNLDMAQAKFKNVQVNDLPSNLRGQAALYGSSLSSISAMLDELLSVYQDLPDLLGVSTSKKYLILFQNSNEIRPTGGFIGSYAIVELNKGKIQSLNIDDIYNPDGQIDVRKIKVEAPAKLKEFLNESDLHIRNSNWDPDFPSSAKLASDLFFKIDGEEFDGVISLDLAVVEGLLKVTGPVFLSQYNEEINSGNMYERAQFHSEFNYQDGSDQKKSFLTVLGTKLLERLFTLPSEKIPDLLKMIQTASTERHIQIYIPNNKISLLLSKYGIDGSIKQTAEDYLQVVNANVGGTKANYFVKNSMKYEVFSRTRDGLLRSELNLSYDHTGKDMSWPGGPYKDYVRVFVPKGSKLTGANFVLNEAIDQDVFKNIEQGELHGYTYFAYKFAINPNERGRLFIRYDLPDNMSITKERKTYSLLWQKQSGTQNDNVEFIFNAPFGMEPSTDSVIKFNQLLNTDKFVSVNLK